MARTSGTAKAAASRSTTTAARVGGPPIEITFKHIEKLGGSELLLDLQVRGGDATHMEIMSPFLQDRVLFEKPLLAPAATRLGHIRVSTHRPIFVFSNATGEILRATVDVSSGVPRLVGGPAGVIVR